MRGGLDDGSGALLRFEWIGERGGVFHEDAAAYEDGFGAELHYERRVGGGGDSSGREIWHGELPCFGDDADQFIRGLMFFRLGVEFFFAKHGEDFHLLNNL